MTSRYLAADSAGQQEWTYTITRDNAAAATSHTTTTLLDASGTGAKTWNFLNPGPAGPAWQIGLISEFIQSASLSGTVYTDDTYTWLQDPAGNPYISAKVSVADPGTPNQQTAKTTQTLDQYGNTTASAIYPYNNTTTPFQTYASTFLNSSTYTSNYIMNRLVSTAVTTGGTVKTLIQNTYGSSVLGIALPAYEMDQHPPIAQNQRGYLVYSVTPARSTSFSLDNLGVVEVSSASDGAYTQVALSSANSYTAPQTIATQSYSQSLSYNSWLGVTQMTGLNGEQLYATYDTTGRPITATSPYGASWNYSYSTAYTLNPPFWQAKTGPDGYTKTTLDGLGGPFAWSAAPIRPTFNRSWIRFMRRVPVPRWVKFRRSRLPIHPARVQPTGPYTSMTVSDGRSVRHSPTAQARRLTPMQETRPRSPIRPATGSR